MVQLLNLGGSVRGSGNQAIALDAGGDAAIVPGSGTLSSLTVEIVDFEGADVDVLGIAAVGGISVPGGMNEESAIFVSGIEIGRIGDYSGYSMFIVLNDGVDKTHVEALLRALTYANASTAPVVAEERSVRVILSETDGTSVTSVTSDIQILVAPPTAPVLTEQSTTVTGTPGHDDFVVDAATPLASVDLTGGSGNDTLHVVGGGLFNLDSTSFSRFWGIEALSGSSAVDTFKISAEHFATLSTIDGGIGDDTFDSLDLRGSYFDFRGKTVLNFSEILFAGGTNPTVIVDDKSVAQLFKANIEGVHVRLVGDTFTEDERDHLLTRGITSVSDDSDALANDPPEAAGLHGDRVGVAAAQTVRLDAGQNFELLDDGLLRKLQIETVASAGGSLGIQTGATITLSHGLQEGSAVAVDAHVIGNVNIATDGLVEILFNGNATAARVQEVVRALTYERAGSAGGAFAERQIDVKITDDWQQVTTSTVTVYGVTPANTAPTGVRLNGQTAVNIAENSVFAAVLSASDPDGDAVSFMFDAAAPGGGNAGGMFVIDAATQQLRLAPGKSLDFETARNHTVYVKALDGRGGVSEAQPLTVSVTDVDEGTTPPPPDLVLVGTKRADRLVGGDGNDRLFGKLGKDALSGGPGQDVFVFDTKPNKRTNLDTITDYAAADDTIWLAKKVFAKLGKKGSATKPQALNKKFFAFDKAKDGNDHLIYVKKTGKLYYDQDGSGTAHAAVQIATLTKNLKGFSAAEFFLI